MTNPVHLLSVAALLLVAFLVGAVIGSLARMIALRQGQKPTSATVSTVETSATSAPLVAAPVIAPLPVSPAPIVLEPAEVPVPDFAATLIALAHDKPPAALVEPASPSSGASPTPAGGQSAAVASPRSTESDMQPAHVAGHTTSGLEVAAPRHDPAPTPVAPVLTSHTPRTAEVIPFPASVPEPSVSRPADMVVGGETVAIVDASDLQPIDELPAEPAAPAAVPVDTALEAEQAPSQSSEDNFYFVPASKPRAPAPAASVEAKSDTIPIPAFAANAPVGSVLGEALPVPEVVASAPVVEPTLPAATAAAATEPAELVPPAVEPEPAAAPASVEPEPAVATSAVEPKELGPATAPDAVEPKPATAPVSVEPEPDTAAPSAELLDEDAAMRAIEGNWTPRRTAPKRIVRAVEAPEGANEAVAASARAVTAARRTAEAVVAEVAEVKVEAGRPAGLDGPRDGRKDDLSHIIGVLPVIETALNKLGIYHFDQISELTDENIGWIEGHLGVPGRIGRELWREQARELSAVLRPKRAAEK